MGGPFPEDARALEIGCGIGRGTVNLARHFARVDGIDVSPAMVRAAQERGLPDNVELHVGTGSDLGAFEDDSFDLVFSHLVFQHIADEQAIASYIREAGRVLAPGGVATLQFDTRPSSLAASAVRRLPDPVLPRSRRRAIRRNRRSPDTIRGFARDAGLVLEAEYGHDTAEHWIRWRSRLTFRKSKVGNRVRATRSPNVQVEIWSDIACPWCYVGKRRFEAALEPSSTRTRSR